MRGIYNQYGSGEVTVGITQRLCMGMQGYSRRSGYTRIEKFFGPFMAHPLTPAKPLAGLGFSTGLGLRGVLWDPPLVPQRNEKRAARAGMAADSSGLTPGYAPH